MAYTADTPNLPDKALMAAAACMAALVITPFLDHGPAALSIGLAAAGLAGTMMPPAPRAWPVPAGAWCDNARCMPGHGRKSPMPTVHSKSWRAAWTP